jgi:hypothetical protein
MLVLTIITFGGQRTHDINDLLKIGVINITIFINCFDLDKF